MNRSSWSRLLVTAALCAAWPIAQAGDGFNQWRTVADIPADECNLQNTTSIVSWNSTIARGEISANIMPLLAEVQRLASQTMDDERPLKDQLSARDLQRFNELNQRMQSMRSLSLIESKHERDAHFLQHIVRVADANYRGDAAQAGRSDDVFQATLRTLATLPSAQLPPDLSDSPRGACSMEAAIHALEREPLRRLDGSNLNGVLADMRALARRNNMSTIDRARLSRRDQDAYDRLMKGIAPLLAAQQFIRELEAIKSLARASEAMYESDKRDLALSGGDYARVGAGIEARIKRGELDRTTARSIDVWRMVDEKVPSDAAKERRQAEAVIDRGGKDRLTATAAVR